MAGRAAPTTAIFQIAAIDFEAEGAIRSLEKIDTDQAARSLKRRAYNRAAHVASFARVYCATPSAWIERRRWARARFHTWIARLGFRVYRVERTPPPKLCGRRRAIWAKSGTFSSNGMVTRMADRLETPSKRWTIRGVASGEPARSGIFWMAIFFLVILSHLANFPLTDHGQARVNEDDGRFMPGTSAWACESSPTGVGAVW